ncbi:DUF2914 domain-containing protein [uncultured Desulfobacter sp.]|uniref:DUF2914 domain-containing protein n=1 Tax=uncultured Desulfobacter sp. TaxID=240139 RepID=UPI002AAADF69|nr:DUF2914 domain-containing protein [uncultured Desulfobacter sp.]
MNKTSIEERDQHLIKKFRNIIEEKKWLEPQEPEPPRHPWPLFTLAGIILGLGIMLIAFYMIPEHVPTDSPSTPEKVETAAPENPAPLAQQTFPDGEKLNRPDETQVPSPLPEPAPVLPTEDVPPPSEVVQAIETDPMEILPEVVSNTDVTIDELVICRHIKNRMYISPENRFSMANGAAPVVWTWMNVLTDKPPQTLTHIYYLNGEPYSRVILQAPYPRTRTWSKVTLNRPKLAGSWRVDVVDSGGQVLARADFIVEI